MKIGENMRALRKKAGLTQQELAQMSGVATISIRQYESGKRRPQVEQLTAISTALGVSVEALLGLLDSHPLDEADDPCKAAEEYLSASIAARHARAIEFSSTWEGNNIITAFRLLNEKGKKEAAKRVRELASIDEYKLAEASETPSTASPAESSTPADTPLEGANQP